jgi:hypothetical protein
MGAGTPLLAVLALLAAACGSPAHNGGSAADPSTTPSAPSNAPAVTKDAFLVQGNAICKTMNDQSLAVTKSYGPSGPTTAADNQAMIEKNAALIEGAVKQLQALPQPTGDEATLAGMYSGVEQLAGYGHQVAAALGRGDTQASKDLAGKADALQATVNAESDAYGLSQCGSGH